MTETRKRIIVVIGGTGMFGGAVARSLHDNPAFPVRVITRDPHTEKAASIERLGIEVVQADSWKPDELAAAFRDCCGLFLNTGSDDPNFKAQIGPPESALGEIVIDAAVPTLSFDNKAAIASYVRRTGFESAATVNSGWELDIFRMQAYAEAFGGFATIRDADAHLTLKVPPVGNDPELMPWTSTEDDYGDAVHGVFLDPLRWDRQTVWAVSECMSFKGVTDTYNKVTGSADARYAVADGGGLSAGTTGKTKEVNGLFDYCHYVKGSYCGGQPLDQAPVTMLKHMASVARGRGASGLQTVEGFLRKMT